MSRRLNRLGLLLVPFIASEVWALGLGDIRLDSALNEPLDAEIALLSVTPEELESLRVGLASAETFGRYGIDRPVFLTRIDFDVAQRGNGYVIDVTSEEAVTEPFVTFLVEASWSRGRLLREYTVLLDPPTFAPPPAAQETQAVEAPRQAAPADRGRIERPARQQPARPATDDAPAGAFDTTAGGDYRVARGDTLWRIAEEVRPDERLSMNQVMLAIYEANPQAFDGNINRLRANASLSIPSADDIYRIGRGDALAEIRRQNEAWTGAAQPTLTLVAPDEQQTDYTGAAGDEDAAADQPLAAGAQERIRRLEQTIAEQESLLEIRDNELAELRQELERLREQREAAAEAPAVAAEPGEDMPAEEPAIEADEIFVEDEPATAAGEPAAEDPAEEATEAEPTPAPVAPTRREAPEPGLVDRILGILTGFWGIVGAALLVVLALLAWFARRASSRGEDAETTGVWEALDADEEIDRESAASTERLRAMARDEDESIVVVEQDSGDTLGGDTVETPRAEDLEDESEQSGIRKAPESVSLEDTFSSETAINLDQSDPIAEADFHMAYGLYDQAADLVNGALAVEPDRSDLLAKLSEIYFVWGNRDAFVEAAGRLKTAAGDSGDWDKIVIMGQQIAPDHELFAGARAGGAATQAVDLDFEGGSESSSALDLDFAGGDSEDDVIDLGGDEEEAGGTTTAASDDGLDFSFGDEDEDTGASATREMPGRGDDEPTVETPTWSGEAFDEDETQESPTFSREGFEFDEDATQESPTISSEAADEDATQESRTVEMQRDRSDETSELPEFRNDEDERGYESRSGDATAEIDLDDLGLDLDGLGGDLDSDDTALLDDEETGTDFDDLAETGRNRELDEDAESRTGTNEKPDDDLLDATGQTQVLPDDFTVETGQHEKPLSDDEATMLSPTLDSDDEDFDFAKTEALPQESFDASDETAERPAAGSTDMDLDLDDLTAALKHSEGGDTVEQRRDDETIEQPRPGASRGDDDLDFDLGLGEDATQEMTPEDVSDELAEARTMTEVGTKLDLARAYVDMGDPGGARNILEEVLEEGDESQRQQAQQLLDSLPG